MSLDTVHIDLIPSTANVHYILSQVRGKWGKDYTIVANDGLKINDSTATRG